MNQEKAMCADKTKALDVDAIAKIRAEIPENVKIVAATKTVPADMINRLPENGIFAAGENRVQEFLEKYDHVSGIDWHFIGRLQTNKVKYVVDKVVMIQSVDRPALIDEIERQCAKIGRVMDVLVEVNCGEDSKGGASLDEVFALADYAAAKAHIRVKGLMCIPPPLADESVYQRLNVLFEGLKERLSDIQYFSCGMSADYSVAVKNGANMIRPGSILFGKRS